MSTRFYAGEGYVISSGIDRESSARVSVRKALESLGKNFSQWMD